MKIFFGDSHVRAIGSLAAKQIEGLQVVSNHGRNFTDMRVTQLGETVHLYSDAVATFDAIDLTVSGDDTVLLSAPLHSSVVSRHPMWRTHVHWTLADKNPGLKVVSDNFFDQVAQSRNRSVFEFLKSAKAIGTTVAVIEPPLLSRRAIAHSQLSANVLALNDQTYRASVRKCLERIGVPVIRTPQATHDGDFMLPEFQVVSDRDLHHGNRKYAELAVPEVVAFLRSGEALAMVDACVTAGQRSVS